MVSAVQTLVKSILRKRTSRLNTPRLKVVEHRLYPGCCATPSNRRNTYFELALLHLAFQGLKGRAG